MAAVKLTGAQQAALARIRRDGFLCDGNGVSYTTVRILAREGLITLTATRRVWTNYRSHRTHHARTWTATAVEGVSA